MGDRRSRGRTPIIPDRPTRTTKKTQDYHKILQECKRSGTLFEDPEFPCVDGSIFYNEPSPRHFEWKRPREICDDPQWITGGASRFDVRLGKMDIGDGWLLAAVTSLACKQSLLHRVVDPQQSFTDDYCGLFKFNFWHQGDWQEVVVDDRLPTYRDQLVFMHSMEKNEFWSALLEKAYAKLMGSYESLKGGLTSEAMEDFTGGVIKTFDLREKPSNLLTIMLQASQRSSLMGCSIDTGENQALQKLDNGLIKGQAYSVTGVTKADIRTNRTQGKISLVRIRDPSVRSEWTGAWSDSSPEWSFLSQYEKTEMGLIFDNDGEFWMSCEDFTSNFHNLEICYLDPETEDLSNRNQWESRKEHGQWVKRVNAGGCKEYNTFSANPQFKMTVTDPDDDDDDDLCSAVVALMQKDRRKLKKEGKDQLTIGYGIYKLEDSDVDHVGPLDINFFKEHEAAAISSPFSDMREVCGRHKLHPGTYVIVPSTKEPNNEGDFLLRIFTEKPYTLGEIDDTTRIGEPTDVSEETEEDQRISAAFKDTFKRVAGNDMLIDAQELKTILSSTVNDFPGEQLQLRTSLSMLTLQDGDVSGKLDFDEFSGLWRDIRKWKGVFKKYDHDKSGFLDSYEFRKALGELGYHLSNDTFQSVAIRYSNKVGSISFLDFILCAAKFKSMMAAFNNVRDRSGRASFDLDMFMQTTMYS